MRAMNDEPPTGQREGRAWRAIGAALALVAAALLAVQSGPFGTAHYEVSAETGLTAPAEETGTRAIFADTAAILLLDASPLARELGEEIERGLEGFAPDLVVELHDVTSEPYAPADGARVADLLVVVDVEQDRAGRRWLVRSSRRVRALLTAGRSPLRAQDVRGTALWCTQLHLDVEVTAETGGLYGDRATGRSIARAIGSHWRSNLTDLDLRPAPPTVATEAGGSPTLPFEVPGDARLVYAGPRRDGSLEGCWIVEPVGGHTAAYEEILEAATADGWRRTGGSSRPGGRPNTLAMERDGDLAHAEFARRPSMLRPDPDTAEPLAITLRRSSPSREPRER